MITDRLPYLLLGLLSAAGSNAQQIESVTVIPQQPTTQNEVLLHVSGQRLSSDMDISSILIQQTANTFVINIDFVAEGVGLPVLSPFDTTVSLGSMEVGDYTATVSGLSMGSPYNSLPAAWTVTTVTGISTARPDDIALRAVPNPFDREFVVTLNLAETKDLDMRLFDILGNEVARFSTGPVASGKQEFRYSATSLPDGRYFLQTIIDGRKWTKQLIKRGH